MSLLSLPERLIRKLVALPETGMGYHLVDLRLSDGRAVKAVMVFNSSEVDAATLPESMSTEDILDILPTGRAAGSSRRKH